MDVAILEIGAAGQWLERPWTVDLVNVNVFIYTCVHMSVS